MAEVATLTKIAGILDVPVGHIYLNTDKIVTREIKETKAVLSGFATILKGLAHESAAQIGKNSVKTPEIEAQVYQWLEYVVVNATPASKDKHLSQQLLQELNNLFLVHSYLVGYTITLADFALYYTIHDLMKSLSPLDKEKYLNLSRWFNHLQHILSTQDVNLVKFPTIYMTSGRH